MNLTITRAFATVGALVSLVGVSHATPFTYAYTGAAALITDATPAGVNFDIVVPSSFTVAQFTSVSLTLATPSHPWAGDLIATLTHVSSGRTIDLFRRIGSTSTTGVGDSTNMGGTYTFSNILAVTGATRLIDAADPLATGVDITNGTYRPTTNTFNAVGTPTFTGETITNLNTTFDGVNVGGTWRLNVSDNAAGDVGTISGFAFTVQSPAVVPETSSLVLAAFGFATAGFAVVRRSRKSA